MKLYLLKRDNDYIFEMRNGRSEMRRRVSSRDVSIVSRGIHENTPLQIILY